jgi:ABC-type transporter Mla subunit MlaD
MAMRRREPPVPLTVQGLGTKLDLLAAGQSKHEDWLRRLADGQDRHEDWLRRLADGHERHVAVLDIHTGKLNELVAGQNAHTTQLTEHTSQLTEHTDLLNKHTRILNEHTELLNGHTELLNGHTELLNEHTRMLRELLRGQRSQTALLEQLVRGRGEGPPSTAT